MSGPFRSEVSQLQEQLLRAEERVASVENERAALERQLLRGRPSRGWSTVVLAAVLASGFVGYILAFVPAVKRQAETEARQARDVSELAGKQAEVAACEASAKAQFAACDVALDAQTKRLRVAERACPAPTQKSPLCMCVAGDPLCACH